MIDDALQSLIDAELADRATPQQSADLAERVRTDPDAARAYVRATFLHAQLRQTLSASVLAEPAASSEPAPASHRIDSIDEPRRRIGFRFALAAAVLIAAAAVALYAFVFSEPTAINGQTGPFRRPVATLVGATGTVLVDNDLATVGNPYASGPISVQSGSAEFVLTNGANVQLRGSTELNVQSAMRSTLTRGSAIIHCPPAAVGYTVVLPDGSSVVDLGTRFTVQIDPAGRARVRVLEGRVMVLEPGATEDGRVLAAGDGVLRRDGQWVADAAPSLIDPAGLVFWLDPRQGIERDAEGRVAGWLSAPLNDDMPEIDARQHDAQLRPRLVADAGSDLASVSFRGGVGAGLTVASDTDVNFNFDRSLTVAAWCRVDRFDSEWQALITKGDSSWRLHRNFDTGRIAFGTSHGSDASDLESASSIDDGRWHLVVAVADTTPDGVVKRLYVDGRLEADERVPSVNHNDHPVVIANNAERPERGWSGWIGEVGLFRRALGANEIASMYRAGHRVSDPAAIEKQ